MLPAMSSAAKTFSAASVVPPLDVTFSRNTPGASGLSAASFAAPTKVWMASARAASGARPSWAPAFSRASMK